MDYLLNKLKKVKHSDEIARVLNLIINGLPSKLNSSNGIKSSYLFEVLNLIINGLPSKPLYKNTLSKCLYSFKPYYKWITF